MTRLNLGWLVSSRTLLILAVTVTIGIQKAESETEPSGMREITVNPSTFVRSTPLPAWFRQQRQLPEASLNEPAVMRLADSHFRVDAQASVVVHRAIQVNDASALAEVGQSPISFQPDYQRVELHWLKVYRNGQVIDKLDGASVRFYHSERSAEQGIYTGLITAVVITQDVRPGDTVETIYSLVGQNPVFAGRYAEAASWDSSIPVLKRRVTLDFPKGRIIDHRVIGSSGKPPPSMTTTEFGERHLIRYEEDNLPSVDQELLVPPDVQPVRWIQFSEFRDWREVGKWATALFELKDSSPFRLPDLVPSTSQAESVMRALKFVQDNIRYLSISIGENSHRPYPPEEVLSRRYGDCKDKSLLLVAMLRRLGIQADPVLVSLQSRKGLGELLPSPALFDHVIVRAEVDGRSIYLDPTIQNQGNSLENLGQTLQGADALMIRTDSHGLQKIPYQRAGAESKSRRAERVQIQRLDKPAEMQIDFAYAAEDAEAARRTFGRLSPAQIRKGYEGILDRRYPQAQLLADPQINDDREQNILTVVVHYRIPNFLEKQDDKWALRLEASNLIDLLPAPANAKRHFPLFFQAFPWSGTYSLEITLPEDYDAQYTPERRSLEAEAFKLDELFVFKGRQITTEVSLLVTKDRIPAMSTTQYLADLRKANGFFRSSIYVSDRDRRNTTASVPLKELSRQRLENVLRNTEKSIAAAKSSGRETAAARCEHALAAAYLDQLEVAREDADSAVNEQPTSPETLRCRGTVRFVSGDFNNSIRDLARALALGENEPDTYFYRGLSHYYAKHWALAAEDFSAFGARAGDEQAKARAAVWAAMARRQAGEPASFNERQVSVWPAPVLRVFNNEATVEDVIEKLNQSEYGQRLDEVLAEAYFYFYQHFAFSNRGKSQAYLKRSLQLGPLYSAIQVAARHETKRIDAMGR